MRWVAICTLALLAAGCGGSGSSAPTTVSTVPKQLFEGSQLPNPSPAPDFALHDENGKPVRLSQQKGRYVLVTFLYTHCPDVCPLIASSLNSALAAIGPARKDVRVLAVSVDPKGDTPAAARAYRKRMHLVPQFQYLIGTRPQLKRVWRAYDVVAVDSSPDRVDHVAYTLLLDRAGKKRVLFDSRVKAHQVVHDLRVLMKRNPTA
jgi:protein SCO1/2